MSMGVCICSAADRTQGLAQMTVDADLWPVIFAHWSTCLVNCHSQLFLYAIIPASRTKER
jgi:hypothetical protein